MTKATESLDAADSERILIDPASLDATDLPPMGASTTDYSDMKNVDGEMPQLKAERDADRPGGFADRKDDEMGLPPSDMDDLSALPAMLGSREQIHGLPGKNLSLDM